MNADGSGAFGGDAFGGDEAEDEDASLQAALAMSMQAPEVALGSSAVAEAEGDATAPGVEERPAEGEEAAAVTQLSELFGDAVSDAEALAALRSRNGNLELAFGDLSSRLGS